MFRHQGPARSDRQNRIVAGYLAAVGGFVNSSGFLLVGSFTSHVTGNIGRLTSDLASKDLHAAVAAATMVAAFFSGAFVASVAIESTFFRNVGRAYGAALVGEAALLGAFILVAHFTHGEHPRLQDARALFLCAAMGLQNSLVTRLSGAVIRTTHMTGTITDLGIESARWFRWWRASLSQRLDLPLSFGRRPTERPSGVKVVLLLTMACAFILGGICGAILVVRLREAALLVPTAAVLACALYAFGDVGDDAAPESRR
jgi:uncharacterized membrane protein YoaK (UPF0700 family)